ncbi:precorrin-3B C(17)-methyltransferase [Entomobacter blattae]|uniref:Precorrin-3B C(17)-methyltransferase n=1 Tax=Entomobacter blattae TaxID=2762277 RepID=A0A7H1NQ24_9PROT|nr:precorrin-3B C(17)-methyltransferase [Entomobacter blattae]QNT77884.1 Precorrin-3B C(17)-methyltransferase [Entomobacter blattae]
MVPSSLLKRLFILSLGPGQNALITPQVHQALSEVSDLFGYGPYIKRLSLPASVTLHPSDNREELHRARQALDMAASGKSVGVVSSGDAGIFAMASTVFEALEKGPKDWQEVTIEVMPGISAMLAVAARVGAPLGHDFCAISLSDNLKPWPIIEKRLIAAAQAGFVLSLYNPISKARPWQLGQAFETLRHTLPGTVPIIIATAVYRQEEHIRITSLSEVRAEWADMRSLVIVGSPYTKTIPSHNAIPWVYTPRFIPS